MYVQHKNGFTTEEHTTQNGFTMEEHILLRGADYLSRTLLQAMVPTNLNFIVNCKLYLTCYAFWFHRSNFFVVPLGHLNFIVRTHHRTLHRHTSCPHLRAIKRPNYSGCVGSLYPKGCSKQEQMGHPCSFLCYPLLPPKHSQDSYACHHRARKAS